MNRAVDLQFGVDILQDGHLRTDDKTTSIWAWPVSRDPISK